MENTIDITIEDNEPVEEIGSEEVAAGGRPRGGGRHGNHGRRRFGPNSPFRFALFVDEDGGYVLRSPDLPARSTAIDSLDDVGVAMQAAITERAAEDAAAAEDAKKDAPFSGKFVLRLPRSMHRQLTELAEAEGVSLNQLALGFLAEGMGRAEMIQEFGERRGPGGGRGPRGGRGRHGGRGPEGFGPEGREFGGRGRGFGRGHRRPNFAGFSGGMQPVEPESTQVV